LVNASHVRLGNADVTRIRLGTNRLTSIPEHIAFVKEAVAAGVDHFATAFTYTGGRSEETIGAALSSVRDRCFAATKGGYPPGTADRTCLRSQVEESLRRPGADSIDPYYRVVR
jgi:aryl-alcohol dehydrogenase-like predicted oxidoreductase